MLSTFAEILSAVAALGALAAAIWAVRVSKRLYEVETSRDLIATQRAEKEQASGFAAWCIVLSTNEEQERQNGILLHNSSDAPVFDIEVLSTYAKRKSLEGAPQPPLKLAILPPGDYVAHVDATYPWSFPEERGSIGGIVRPVTNNPNWAVTELHFTDSHETRWIRRGGKLEKQPANGVGAGHRQFGKEPEGTGRQPDTGVNRTPDASGFPAFRCGASPAMPV
jgi:hypothetical protein